MWNTRTGAVLGATIIAVLLAGGTATAAHLITGAQIRDRSITIRDLAISARPHAGRVGPQGPAGPAGAAGGLNAVTTVTGTPVPYAAATDTEFGVGSAQVDCPAGTTLVGGGYYNADGTAFYVATVWDAPKGPNTWGVIVVNADETAGDELVAVAQCATGTATAAPSATRGADAGAARRFAATLAGVRGRVR